MIECSIHNLEKSFGAKQVFKNVTFDIKSGDRVGLIGKNGTGKTTLMKNLLGEEDYNGDIHFRKGCKVAYLEQIPNYDEAYSVHDVLCLAFEKIFEIKKQITSVEQRLSECSGDDAEKEIKRYSALQEEFQLQGGYEMEEKLSKITTGLKISDDMQKRTFNHLSGGEKSRVILGKILLEEPDLLLLDEPSNHLDLTTIEWLEEYLRRYKGALLMISHDRYFLDEVVTRIIELKPEGVETYEGNYSYYVDEKEKRFLEALKEYNNQQKEIKKMEEQIKRFRIWGESRDSDKMYVRAKELEKRLEKIDELDKPTHKERAIRLGNSKVDRSGKEVLIIKDLEKSFGANTLFKDLSLKLFYQDSLGIIGANGCGKSTLFKIILGEQKGDSGSINLGSNVKIGYLPQEIVFDDESKTVLETFQYAFDLTSGEARHELAKVLFIQDDVFKQVSTLSGGEKSRLKLCMMLYEKVNLLVLDEPTNHLDIDSRESLEETLTHFNGTILFVSHDRYFIDKMGSRIGEMEDKSLKLYEGDYKYYKSEKAKIIERMQQEEKAQKEKAALKKEIHGGSKKSKKSEEEQLRQEIKKYKKKLQQCETKIESIETEIGEIDLKMEKFATEVEKLYELTKEKSELEENLEIILGEWEELESKIQELEKAS